MGKIILYILCIQVFICSVSSAQINPLNLCLTQDTTNSSESTAYPTVGMGTGTTFGTDDWTYNNVKLDLFIVVKGNQKLLSADIIVQWDSTYLILESFPGNLFSPNIYNKYDITTGRQRINIANLSGNVQADSNKYLVKLTFRILKPGASTVNIVSSDLRYYDEINDMQVKIPVTNNQGHTKFYVGDFARTRTITYKGDGDINYKDVAMFAQHYGGVKGSDLIYRSKYDIYPTENYFDFYRMPVGDGVIDFYDMVLFTIAYNYEATGVIQGPYMFSGNGKKINVELLRETQSVDKLVYKISVDGDYNDLMALSVKLDYDVSYLKYNNVKYLGNSDNDVLSGVIDNNGKMSIDASVLKNKRSLTANPGNIYEVTFDVIKSGNITQRVFITSAEAFDNSLRLFKTTFENKR